MRQIFSIVFLLSVTLISCQKEITDDTGGTTGGGGTNASLLGTWNFAGIQASTYYEVSEDIGGTIFKEITNAGYITKQNTGTYTFAADKLTQSNVGYSIDTTVTGHSYIDGVFQDSTILPFQLPLSTQSNTTGYKLIGTDSIYFSGSGVDVNTGGSGADVQPSGAKYKIVGNTLTLSFSVARDTTIDDSGVSAVVKEIAKGTIKLVK